MRFISPYAFNGVGNGGADDTEALQKAWSFARKSDNTGLDLQGGSWRISDSIGEWSSEDGPLVVIGDPARANKIWIDSDINKPIFLVNGSGTSRHRHGLFQDVAIRSTNNERRKFSVLEFYNVWHYEINSLWVEGCEGSVIEFFNCWDSLIHRPVFLSCGNDSSPIVSLTGGSNNLIFDYAQFESGYGMYVVLSKARKCVFNGCKFHGTQPPQRHEFVSGANQSANNIFVGCNFTWNRSHHVNLQESTRRFVFSGCSFDASSAVSVVLRGKDHILSGCVFGGTSANAANIQDHSMRSVIQAAGLLA